MLSLVALAILSGCRPQADLAHIQQLVRKRDINALNELLVDKGAKDFSPFYVLTDSAYGVGAKGWDALEFEGIDHAKYLVVTTPLTSEDTGELLFRRLESKLQEVPESDAMGVTLKHHDMVVSFSPKEKIAHIEDEVSFTADADGMFFVRLSPCYKVKRIVDDSNEEISFTQGGGVVSLPKRSGDFHYRFTIEGFCDLRGLAGSVSPKEALLTNDYFYPMVARQPATFRTTITTPVDWKAISIGEVSGDTVDYEAKTRTVTYQMNVPISYYSLSAAPYKRVKATIRGRNYWILSEKLSQQDMEDQLQYYATIIDFYSERIEKYPWTSYGAVVTDAYGDGGALEAYTFATYEQYPGDDGHEVAHTWFGGIIDNTYLRSFWNESFADYCNRLYHREVPLGSVEARRLAYAATPTIDPKWTKAPIREAGVNLGSIGSSLGYGKGEFVLSMLEQEIGPDEMFRVLGDWVRTHDKTRSAEWEDFQVSAEKTLGRSLDVFFKQWLDRTGVPDLSADGVRYEAGAVVGTVHFKGDAYAMPLEVLIEGAGKKLVQKVKVDADNLTFRIPVDFKPSLVSIDPYRVALRNIHDDERPPSIAGFAKSHVWREKGFTGRKDAGTGVAEVPTSFAGWTLIGSLKEPRIASLLKKAGFDVRAGLSYHGRAIDLTKENVTALVDLGGGKSCLVATGSTRHAPDYGASSVFVGDILGRMLDGATQPKRKGFLTFTLP